MMYGKYGQHETMDMDEIFSPVKTTNERAGLLHHRSYSGELSSPVHVHTPTLNAKNYPLAMGFLLIAQWVSFLVGLFVIIGVKKAEYSTYAPLSPPIDEMEFAPVGHWPYCNDQRHHVWSILLHQFVHAGFLHIVSNQLMAVLYGSIIECFFGWLPTLLIFQTSLISGTLGHCLFWSYRTLVGCSHGVYGLLGATLSMIILNIDSLERTVSFSIVIIISVQLISDLIYLLVWFNSMVAYEAHFFGFLNGLLLGLLIFKTPTKRTWKTWLCRIIIVVYSTFIVYILYHYIVFWPPKLLTAPEWSTFDWEPCCAELLATTDSSEKYWCDGTDLVPKYSEANIYDIYESNVEAT